MREKLAKFFVADEVFDMISKYGNTTVPYIAAEGFEKGLRQMDFIIFYNAAHEERLKLYWASDEECITYTSDFSCDCDDIPWNALCSILYHTIMWLRHRAYLEDGIQRLFKKFPKEQIAQHLQVIDCVWHYLKIE